MPEVRGPIKIIHPRRSGKIPKFSRSMEVEGSSVKKEGGDGSGGGGKRPRGNGPTPAGSPAKKGKKEEVARRCISISWLYTRSHSLVLQLLRLQLFDDGFMTDDDAALLAAVDPHGAMAAEFRILVRYERCLVHGST